MIITCGLIGLIVLFGCIIPSSALLTRYDAYSLVSASNGGYGNICDVNAKVTTDTGVNVTFKLNTPPPHVGASTHRP
jgi:hypothetical protein